MYGLGDEIVYFLIVAVVLLARYFWQRRNRVQPWEEALARRAPESEPEPEPGPPPAGSWPAPNDQWGARLPEPVRATRAPPAARSQPAPRMVRQQPAAAPTRRFSRQTLFGSRRQAQAAVVASTILGPCRAMSPYDDRP
jgi:hypothetical protein